MDTSLPRTTRLTGARKPQWHGAAGSVVAMGRA